MALLPPIPYRSPFMDTNTTLVTRPWQQWLAALVARAGGEGNVEALSQVANTSHTVVVDLTALMSRMSAAEAAALALDGRADALEATDATFLARFGADEFWLQQLSQRVRTLEITLSSVQATLLALDTLETVQASGERVAAGSDLVFVRLEGTI